MSSDNYTEPVEGEAAPAPAAEEYAEGVAAEAGE